MKEYKHIIWDWNGTLLEDVELCVSIINSILAEKEMKTVSTDEYKEIFTIPVVEYYKKLNFDFEEESFESLGKKFIDKYEELKYTSYLYPDAAELLMDLHQAGYRQSVLSGYYQNTLEEIIEHFDLLEYFDHLVGMDNIYAGSKIENGKKLIDMLDCNGEGILLVGDTCHDLDVANEIGADAVLLSCGHQSEHKLKQCGATVFRNLNELKQILLKK